jgi:hypothetical protein
MTAFGYWPQKHLRTMAEWSLAVMYYLRNDGCHSLNVVITVSALTLFALQRSTLFLSVGVGIETGASESVYPMLYSCLFRGIPQEKKQTTNYKLYRRNNTLFISCNFTDLLLAG